MTKAARLTLVAALLAAALPARTVAGAEPSPAAKAEARDRFSQGLRLFEKGENAAALAEFKRAYELIPSPVVLYNVGLVYAAMDRPVDAVDALDRFIAEGGNALAGEQGRRARQTRAEQAARVAEVDVATSKPATIEVDGVEVGRTPLAHPLRVASGAHVLSAQAPGYLPAHRELTLAGQVRQTVTFDLLPTESSAAHLILTVSVPGAEILVGGKSVGTSPLAASVAVAPGDVRIEGRRAGYRPAMQTVHLDEGASGAVALTLDEDPTAPAALKGRLELAISEPGAEISVDGTARPLEADGLTLAGGPHVLHVARAGFVPYERTVDVAAGGETRFVVDMVPTVETRQREKERAYNRRILAWSVLGSGAALAAGAAIYAASTRHDVSSAQAALDAQLLVEMNPDPSNHCYAGMSNSGPYGFFKCDQIKASLQDQVDTAKLRRDFAYGGIGVGLIAAGVGTYLLSTIQAEGHRPGVPSGVALWSDGRGGGLVALGRF